MTISNSIMFKKDDVHDVIVLYGVEELLVDTLLILFDAGDCIYLFNF